MSRKSLVLFLCFVIFSLVLSACFVETELVRHGPWTSARAGTYTGTAKGFGEGVTVTITFNSSGVITKAVVTGPNETNVGKNAIAAAPGIIVATNTVLVDKISGATHTTGGIVEAGKKAFSAAGVNL